MKAQTRFGFTGDRARSAFAWLGGACLLLGAIATPLVAQEAGAGGGIVNACVPFGESLKQTNPSTATVEVEYDGDPELKQIEGTELSYVVNASTSVIVWKGRYYACDNGVWFVSDEAGGPWAVATERPEGVEEIPPSYPCYNVKYVYIYDYTPTVVYVGYLPGYTGCYVYHGVVVYGTGYYYPGWYRTVYYARPATWGRKGSNAR